MKGNNFYLLLIALLVLIIIYLRYCSGGMTPVVEKITVKRDTVYRVVKDSSGWKVPSPKIVLRKDTLLIPSLMPVDSAELLRLYYNTQLLQDEYFASRYYEDTTHTQYGYIITKDTVTENKIVAHKVITSLNIPTVAETITVQAPSRTQLYAGLGVLGGRTDFIRGYEGSLLLKTKKDKMYEVGGVMLNDGNLYLKAGIKFKISFKKKTQ